MKASSSLGQQNIEKYILETLNKQEGLDLRPTKLKLDKNTEVWLDGYDERNSAICEIYAHIGKLKGSQPDKIASDFLKMILVQKCKKISLKKIFCFASEEAAKKVIGKSWLALTAKEFNIDIVVILLPKEKEKEILQAQKRQKMINKYQ